MSAITSVLPGTGEQGLWTVRRLLYSLLLLGNAEASVVLDEETPVWTVQLLQWSREWRISAVGKKKKTDFIIIIFSFFVLLFVFFFFFLIIIIVIIITSEC